MTGWPAGVPIAVVKSDTEHAAQGEIFTSHREGQIAKLSDTGTVAADPFAVLPGERGRISAVHVDRTGVFGEDLLAGTAAGNIWRVDGNGRPAFVAATGFPITSLISLPNDDRYGSWAGMLLAASAPPDCRLLVVSAAGKVTVLDAKMCVTDLELVAPDSEMWVAAAPDGGGAGVLLRMMADELGAFGCNVAASDAAGAIVVFSGGTVSAAMRRPTPGLSPKGLAFATEANACRRETCGDEIDNDGDGEVDEECEEICDGVDNDSDGDVDEDCPELCGDGEDNDEDGIVDEGCTEVCGDGVDNDSDGIIDTPCPEACGDQVDNDGNGQVDETCPHKSVDAGCRPEIWAERSDQWMGLDPRQLAGTAFGLYDELAPLGLESLSALLSSPPALDKDPGRALLRASIAATLNANHSRVGYPIAPERIAQQVNAALESRNPAHMSALASVLAAMNELRCMLPPPAGALKPGQKPPP